MTDERIETGALLAAVRRLPAGAGMVLRHRGSAEHERRALLRAIRAAGRPGLVVLLAGSARQARAWGADGVHLGSASVRRPAGLRPAMLVSAAAHGGAELRRAGGAGANVVFLSPLFSTRSHPGAPALGPARFGALARRAGTPVIALGGVRPRHARLVRALGAYGFAAIDGLVRKRK